MQLVRVRRTDTSSRSVANRVGGVWKPADDYKDRIHHVSASSVNLTRVNFNDDAFYEFTCKSDLMKTIQLTVIFPYDVRVSEGETARIPCYSSTEGLQGGSARWERDGELVLGQNRSSGQPEGRLSVSPDWIQTGDLSLTVKDAQLEDGGNYVCYTVDGNGEKTRGRSPAAVKVTVQRSRPAPTGTLQPTPGPDEEQTGPGLIVSIILNVLLLAVVLFCVVCLFRVRTTRSHSQRVGNENVLVRKARRAAGVRPPADTEMEPLGGDPDHVPNGGAHRAEP
ncbi:leucine-rich repeat and immunoglobulin-like domain-containing nogo receptor-interacting protein 1-B [Sparus aurata]|uniref:leucine-rich repeat and immunoglobulin-like domain-containing nogo receptor-interacting protein 1-B n=1 Tax=Sparus aurata TaxID=8175 RepID=UPI0011C0E016|nr:leucine-rich repeat and immunoglobulin-like domain-containing nogo receptor-interacting protein 1-B [Sparus aurata]